MSDLKTLNTLKEAFLVMSFYKLTIKISNVLTKQQQIKKISSNLTIFPLKSIICVAQAVIFG